MPGAPSALVAALQPGAPAVQKAALEQKLSEGSYSEVLEGRLERRCKGYYAAKDLKKGDALLFDTALCASPAGPSACATMAKQCNKKRESRFFAEEVMSLETGRFLGETGADGRLVEAILANNARECTRELDYVALFVATSHFRHSCSPNAFVDSSKSQAVVRALCDIPIGKEVFVSYVPVSLDLESRRCRLGRGFVCSCKRCKDEAIKNPQFIVSCKCGNGEFNAQKGSADTQVCDACGSTFELAKSLRFLAEFENANKFMLTQKISSSSPQDLAEALEKRLEKYCFVPPLHPQVLQLINNVANCYYYAMRAPMRTQKSRSESEALSSAFHKHKKLFLEGLERNHGMTNQREIHYFRSLYRMLKGTFPTADEHAVYEEKFADLCILHFGQCNLPESMVAAMQK